MQTKWHEACNIGDLVQPVGTKTRVLDLSGPDISWQAGTSMTDLAFKVDILVIT